MTNDLPEKDLQEIIDVLKQNGEGLQKHQEEGLSVLWKWEEKGVGGIVADEMGLGKTCTSIVHLWRLNRIGAGPFLVVCPLSVVEHWKHEVKRFSCGTLDPICFIGFRPEREQLLSNIGHTLDREKVFILPYHLFTNEQEALAPLFSHTTFSHVVADEAHTLKNSDARVTQLMRQVSGRFILMTGTPIQNNVGELYSLLFFCDARRFPVGAAKKFVLRHKEDKKVDELKSILKEFSIRRRKELVCDSIPPMEEVIFYHGLTAAQKELYINILIKNREAISSRRDLSLLNQLMLLRKAVAHPYLFPGQEPEPFVEGEHIVTASAKLKVLDVLLTHARNNGHRCLVFSQFTSLLDIIQDYLNLRGWRYERLDGSARAEERFASINSFQSEELEVFLLSTKAGGVGLTLTKADTVVFLDNDWNPQNDLQAMARCHRIGQKKPVRVIRLVARYTVEQLMMSRARAKLKLTDTLTDEQSAKPLAADVVKMLEYGLAKLREDNEEEKDHVINNEQLERIIGETDNEGKWMTVGERDENMDFVKQLDEADEDDDIDDKDYFYFEGIHVFTIKLLQMFAVSGKRYRVDEKDDEAMKEVMREKGVKPSSPMKVWSREERAEMQKQRKETAEKRKALAEQKKLTKWKNEGYTSKNIELLGNADNELDEEEDEEEDGGVEMKFVTGDMTMPQADGSVIVIHAVDNSGSFGSGGVFSALDRVSHSIREAYEWAGKMGDIALGDAHIVDVKMKEKEEQNGDEPMSALNESSSDCKNRWTSYSVALVVAQRMKKRDELVLASLAIGLRRVAGVARTRNASVHVARMSHGISNVTWYAIEKTLKKELALRGVQVFVYYRPRTIAPLRNSGLSVLEERTLTIPNDRRPKRPLIPSQVEKPKRMKTTVDDSDEDMDDSEEEEDESDVCELTSSSDEDDEVVEMLSSDSPSSEDEDEEEETGRREYKPRSSTSRAKPLKTNSPIKESKRRPLVSSSEDEKETGKKEYKPRPSTSSAKLPKTKSPIKEAKSARNTSMNAAQKKGTEKENNEDREDVLVAKAIRGVFSGCTVYLSKGVHHLRERIVSAGGAVVQSPLYLYDVTHAIIPSEERASEGLAISLLPKEAIITDEDYIVRSIRSSSLQK